MVSWASRPTKVLLRVVLTLLLVVLGLEVGIKLAPGLARFGAGRTTPGFHNSQLTIHHFLQPDWGGGRLSFPARSTAGIVDSVIAASQEDSSRTRAWSGQAGGVVLRRIGRTEDGRRETEDGLRAPVSGPRSPVSVSRPDYALTLALPFRGQPGRSGLFELPSSGHFKKELLPGAGEAEAPAADIPLYPRSSCRTQVGRGTACFVGFYLTPDSVEAVRSFYVRTLSRLGWERVTGDGGRKTEDGGREMETFTKPGEDRTVVVQLRKQDSVTTRIGLVAMSSGSPQ